MQLTSKMRKLLFFILTLCSLGLQAQKAPADSVAPVPQLKAQDSLLTEFDQRLLDQTLIWLDTTECTAEPDTVRLPDSIYIQRLASLPHIIEMPYNNIVRRLIDRYVLRSPRQVASLQRTAKRYFPIFEEALMRHDLPTELKYLPVIESGLNATARSHMGAAGLWQFMPHTGKLCGLDVNSLIDERLDPIKSTEAACRFLKNLYNIYGDWNLAIAAYNCGPGNVNKAIHRSGGQRDFWAIYDYLPRETRSYLPIFIAANYAMNFADEHNICPATEGKLPLVADTVMVTERLHLQQVAEITGISMQDLRLLNPQYRLDVVPGGKPYALCLPLDKTGAFIQLQDTIFKHKADSLLVQRRQFIDLAKISPVGDFGAGGCIYYTIKRGDTLGGIAQKYKVTVKQLQRWNNLKNTNIREGRKLKIYK